MPNRYRNIPIVQSNNGIKYRKNSIYSEIQEDENDIYLITTYGDRYDILAQQYYNDSQLWWIIASANNYYKGTLTITPGVQLRVPTNKSRILQNFENVNKTR